MNNKKILTYFILVLSILLLLFVLFIVFNKKNKSINTKSENNVVSTSKEVVVKEDVYKNLDLIEVIKNYNLEDKYIKKSIDGSIFCGYDLNCVKRYFMECNTFRGMFTDGSVKKDFIIIGKGLINSKCMVNVMSGDRTDGDYSCNISKENLSLNLFDKISNLNSRKNLDICIKL